MLCASLAPPKEGFYLGNRRWKQRGRKQRRGGGNSARLVGFLRPPNASLRKGSDDDSFFGVENDDDDDDDDSHNNIDAEEKERDVAFCIDRGGTFTDVYCEYVESGRKKKLAVKLLSEDPKNYTSAPREGTSESQA